MNHKKALKKILKWAGSLLLSSLFTAPVIFILIICGVVIALFGKSSTSSGDVSFSENLFQKFELFRAVLAVRRNRGTPALRQL